MHVSLKSNKYIQLQYLSGKMADGFKKPSLSLTHRSRLAHQGSLQFKHDACSETLVVLYFDLRRPCLFSPFPTTPRILYHRNGGRLGFFRFDLEFSSIIKHHDRFYVKYSLELVNSRY